MATRGDTKEGQADIHKPHAHARAQAEMHFPKTQALPVWLSLFICYCAEVKRPRGEQLALNVKTHTHTHRACSEQRLGLV